MLYKGSYVIDKEQKDICKIFILLTSRYGLRSTFSIIECNFSLGNIGYIVSQDQLHRNYSTIDSGGFKGGTRGAPIMPRDTVSRTANVERTGRHKWVNLIAYT